MLIPIKGMVCNHCVEAVAAAIQAAQIPGAHVRLGEAEVPDSAMSASKLQKLDEELALRGFERITDQAEKLIERTKLAILEHVRDERCRFNLSACLQDHLDVDYSTISKLFSSREGRTIEKYAIAQRAEYVKELLSYRQLNISEIADKTGYSSVAHLSRQFKSVTGMTPSYFLKNSTARIPLNEV